MNADDNEIIKITKIKDIAIGLNGLLTYNIEMQWLPLVL